MVEHVIELQVLKYQLDPDELISFFISKVRTGGDWDLKNQSSWNLKRDYTYIYHGKELRYDDVGNIHFGFVGRLLFPKEILLAGAGLYQIKNGNSHIYYLFSNFDDPQDQAMIAYGYDLWDSDVSYPWK